MVLPPNGIFFFKSIKTFRENQCVLFSYTREAKYDILNIGNYSVCGGRQEVGKAHTPEESLYNVL